MYLILQLFRIYWFRYRFRRSLVRYMPSNDAKRIYLVYVEKTKAAFNLRNMLSSLLKARAS